MVKQLKLQNHSLELGKRTLIMGILNITPDSFSGDGIYEDPEKAVARALTMMKEGASIIDIGGESSRPGSQPVNAKEELGRVIPVVKSLVECNVPISVDTYKPEVAREVLKLGADMINDITGLTNPKMKGLIADYEAGVVIMHMKGEPKTMQNNPIYEHGVMEEVKDFLASQILMAEEAGIAPESIVIDPGIGFGKTIDHNLEIIRKLASLKDLSKPIMVGTSRKSFIGKILDLHVEQILEGTLATVVASVMNGADIVRVHDVPESNQALTITDTLFR
ncbi:MAG TPA: dihydropteroate synthase [Candidatus Bathyarchaeia archaeon]|nr:dihydropteroate synthase [Candidatus Bathyarchaeia archaeon]